MVEKWGGWGRWGWCLCLCSFSAPEKTWQAPTPGTFWGKPLPGTGGSPLACQQCARRIGKVQSTSGESMPDGAVKKPLCGCASAHRRRHMPRQHLRWWNENGAMWEKWGHLLFSCTCSDANKMEGWSPSAAPHPGPPCPVCGSVSTDRCQRYPRIGTSTPPLHPCPHSDSQLWTCTLHHAECGLL